MRGCPDCPRGLDTCVPLDNIISDEEPRSFICVGYNDGSDRVVEQDYMTLCTVNEAIDDRAHVDRYDLLDQMSVIATSLSTDEHCRRVWAAEERDPFAWLKEQLEMEAAHAPDPDH